MNGSVRAALFAACAVSALGCASTKPASWVGLCAELRGAGPESDALDP